MSKKLKQLSCVKLISGATLCSLLSNSVIADAPKVYGYFAWRTEKVWGELDLDENGDTSTADAPREIGIPSFNIMVQDRVDDNVKVFINLNGSDAGNVSVNNIWGEYKVSDKLNFRIGKTYRRFGLYNEILDAVPTYIGIEAPELFDSDHLILSRETLAMVHGRTQLGDGDFRYSFSLDNGEGGASRDNYPIGYDFRYEWGLGNYIVGVSGYTSDGETTSDVGLGDGSPNSGVLPWMAADEFSVFGAYGQFFFNSIQLQVAYWSASHNAVRDPNTVALLLQNTQVNQAQRARFLLDDNGPQTADNIDTNGDYDITTWYIRSGYSIQHEKGEFVPYVQWDFYENPETIRDKTFGGDNEAGLADDGQFSKATLGLIYRPKPQVAIKLDGSVHFQEFNGESESYPEIRLDISYIFGQ